MVKKKITPKTTANIPAVAGHNRRISPFDRNDVMEWGKVARKLDPIEALVASWLSDAEVLKRHGQTDMAKLIEQHASELKKVISSSSST